MSRPDKTTALKLDLLFWRMVGARYQTVADRYGLSVSAVWKAIHRWRRQRAHSEVKF